MSSMRSLVLSLLAAAAFGLAGASPSDAQVRSAPMAPAPSHLAKASTAAPEPPARIAAGFAVEPLASLVEAEKGAAEMVEAVAAWNRAGRVPLRNGIVRPLPLSREVRFGAGMESAAAGLHAGGAFVQVGADTTVWGASVHVAEAYRLRLLLEDVSLPAGARLWVYGDDGEARAFGPELAHEGNLWTPSVAGPTIRLEVELPRTGLSKPGFRIARVAELFELDATGAPVLGGIAPKGPACLVDVSCVAPATFPVIEDASKAIAQLEFMSGGLGYVCSGGLLNLAAGAPAGVTPPLLTANHCIATAAEAASLEATWDFRSSTCDGTPPSLGSLPRTNGGSLLVTSAETDYTLIEHAFPPGRVLLGWDATVAVQPKDTVLHRLSHPVYNFSLQSLRYTRYRVKGEAELVRCDLEPGDPPANDLAKFHHTVFLEGGTFGGSSGAPLMTEAGAVVGQLLGACGPTARTDGCSIENDELDGNFTASFDTAAPYLGAVNPGDVWHSTTQIPGFEFQVVITGNQPVDGQPESSCIVETFCASGALAGRPEVFVKIIGPRPNGYLWVQISRFTPSKVEVWVRQTATDEVRYYTLDPVGGQSDDVPGLQDRQAFTP